MKRAHGEITDLHIQQLQTFATVYEHSSYAGAAREIGLSVPTIWEQVKSLEAIYGRALFVKRGRRIEPTPAGKRLYDSLGPILTGLGVHVGTGAAGRAIEHGSHHDRDGCAHDAGRPGRRRWHHFAVSIRRSS